MSWCGCRALLDKMGGWQTYGIPLYVDGRGAFQGTDISIKETKVNPQEKERLMFAAWAKAEEAEKALIKAKRAAEEAEKVWRAASDEAARLTPPVIWDNMGATDCVV